MADEVGTQVKKKVENTFVKKVEETVIKKEVVKKEETTVKNGKAQPYNVTWTDMPSDFLNCDDSQIPFLLSHLTFCVWSHISKEATYEELKMLAANAFPEHTIDDMRIKFLDVGGATCFIENEHDWETFKTGPCRLLKRKLIPLKVSRKLPRTGFRGKRRKERKIEEGLSEQNSGKKIINDIPIKEECKNWQTGNMLNRTLDDSEYVIDRHYYDSYSDPGFPNIRTAKAAAQSKSQPSGRCHTETSDVLANIVKDETESDSTADELITVKSLGNRFVWKNKHWETKKKLGISKLSWRNKQSTTKKEKLSRTQPKKTSFGFKMLSDETWSDSDSDDKIIAVRSFGKRFVWKKNQSAVYDGKQRKNLLSRSKGTNYCTTLPPAGDESDKVLNFGSKPCFDFYSDLDITDDWTESADEKEVPLRKKDSPIEFRTRAIISEEKCTERKPALSFNIERMGGITINPENRGRKLPPPPLELHSPPFKLPPPPLKLCSPIFTLPPPPLNLPGALVKYKPSIFPNQVFDWEQIQSQKEKNITTAKYSKNKKKKKRKIVEKEVSPPVVNNLVPTVPKNSALVEALLESQKEAKKRKKSSRKKRDVKKKKRKPKTIVHNKQRLEKIVHKDQKRKKILHNEQDIYGSNEWDHLHKANFPPEFCQRQSFRRANPRIGSKRQRLDFMNWSRPFNQQRGTYDQSFAKFKRNRFPIVRDGRFKGRQKYTGNRYQHRGYSGRNDRKRNFT